VSPAAGQRQTRGRAATGLVLRLWVGLLALLLCGSSLGETAHLVLVQHAVCTEHGELIELHDGATAAASVAADTHEEGTRVAAPADEGEHEHCQLLGRKQQDLTLPEGAAAAAISQAPGAGRAALHESPTALAPLSALSLAPKTSPPASAAFG
jgi:hypothetical protein